MSESDRQVGARAVVSDGERMETVRHLARIPRKPLPPGHVVVHNHVRPQPWLGMWGFRAWIAAPGDGYAVERCDCGWAPKLREHYRVKSEADK
jgi:hypothetical protein